MVELYYDLHIHSCLSPCGDGDMTPANIAGMAALKGLDVIALTDHNSCRNCPALLTAAAGYGILALPGMELCTCEEVHVLCLFEKLEDALDFDRYVYERILPIENQEEIFGKQEYYDEQDRVSGTESRLLISATTIPFDAVYDLTARFHGIMIPAHIDKPSTSLLANLGFVPPESRFTCAEVKNLTQLHRIRTQNPYLEQIHEPQYTIAVKEKTCAAVLAALAAPPTGA